MTTVVKADISNADLARELGMSQSAISRLRSSERGPSLNLMFLVSRLLGWGIEDQSVARHEQVWSRRFEEELVKKYGKSHVESARS